MNNQYIKVWFKQGQQPRIDADHIANSMNFRVRDYINKDGVLLLSTITPNGRIVTVGIPLTTIAFYVFPYDEDDEV